VPAKQAPTAHGTFAHKKIKHVTLAYNLDTISGYPNSVNPQIEPMYVNSPVIDNLVCFRKRPVQWKLGPEICRSANRREAKKEDFNLNIFAIEHGKSGDE
jgi:hypothetical protein